MDAKLVIVGGKANKSHVSVTLPAIIGRSREADLTVAHPMVSRKHCQLHEVDGLVVIRDLGSLNGTFVDQKQVSEAALHPDAEFTVGPLTFRIEYEYVGGGIVPPEVAAPVQAADLPDTEVTPDEADFLTVDQGAAPGPPEAAPPVEGSPAVEAQPAGEVAEAGIAPPDGALPDLSAWGGDGAASGDDEQAGVPSPPPPPLPPAPPGAEPPTLFAEGAEADLAETLELGGPHPVVIPEVEIADPGGPDDGLGPPPAPADISQEAAEAEAPDESDESGGAEPPEEDASDDGELDDFLKRFE
jgi:predicted component of type VI protein secretion system